MKIEVKMAIMSHLSDAQELMSMGCINESNFETNFVKAMVRNYPQTDIEVDEEELDDLWKKTKEKFGKHEN